MRLSIFLFGLQWCIQAFYQLFGANLFTAQQNRPKEMDSMHFGLETPSRPNQNNQKKWDLMGGQPNPKYNNYHQFLKFSYSSFLLVFYEIIMNCLLFFPFLFFFTFTRLSLIFFLKDHFKTYNVKQLKVDIQIIFIYTTKIISI